MKVVVRLWGGLGNQLFQYAFGYAAAKRNKCELCLDTRYYSEKKLRLAHARTPSIFKMNLDIKVCEVDDEINLCVDFYQNKWINRILRVPSFLLLPCHHFKYFKESRLRFYPEILNIQNNMYFDGYWQTEKYFKDYRLELVKQYQLICETDALRRVKDKIKSCNSVAVHVRRGDYTKKHINIGKIYEKVLEISYFKEAIENITKQINSLEIFIFTNDICWVKDNFPCQDNLHIVSEIELLSDIEEFSAMCACKHFILSNSSFSWWAAWLSENPHKYVIAPKQWNGNADIIPQGWHIL